MAWSTSELAELAGTTVKAIRHYHQIGLLEEPERSPNNYKQYGISHLVRLLKITRLTSLEVPLAQITFSDDGDAVSEEALRLLDDDLAATIERLTRVRSELALILGRQASTVLPADFGPDSLNFSAADRALIMIYSRVLSPGDLHELFQMMREIAEDPTHREFDNLASDADEVTRASLAARFASRYLAVSRRYPWVRNPASRAPRGAAFVASTISHVFSELYNEAQLDVVRRINDVLLQSDDSGSPS